MTPNARAPLAANSSHYFFAQDATSVALGRYDDQGDLTRSVLVESSAGGTISALAASEDSLFLAGRCGNALICKFDLNPPGTVYAVEGVYRSPPDLERPTVVQLFVDVDTLYWSARTNGSGSTWRCKLPTDCSLTATQIAAVAAQSFSRNATNVYFVADELLYRIGR